MVQICIVIIQEPWLVNGNIRGLGNCCKVLKANTADKTRTRIITKGTDVTVFPQLSCGDLTAAQLRLTVVDGTHRNVIVGPMIQKTCHSRKKSRFWSHMQRAKC